MHCSTLGHHFVWFIVPKVVCGGGVVSECLRVLVLCVGACVCWCCVWPACGVVCGCVWVGVVGDARNKDPTLRLIVNRIKIVISKTIYNIRHRDNDNQYSFTTKIDT